MTATEVKQYLKEIKQELRTARFIDINYNVRDSRCLNVLRSKSLNEFGTDLLRLIERGYSEFEVEKDDNGYFVVFTVKATKEFKAETLNEFISRTGNYGC